jgi:tetratricopeptide (TPR) repeat protein
MKKKNSTFNILPDLIDNQSNVHSSDDFFDSLIKKIDSDQPIPSGAGYKAADYTISKDIQTGSGKTFDRDCLTIKNAIKAICSENYSQAVDLIRPLSFDSHFSQWKLLLRGMIAFYTGDDEKAENTFLKIEPSTVPSEIAGSFLILIDKNKYLKKEMVVNENSLVNSCVLAGYPDYKTILPAAEYLWMTGRYGDSLIHVAKSLSGFPALETGIKGDLTNFFFNMPHHIEEEELDSYIRAFNEIIGQFKGKFTIEMLLIQRTASILNISFDDTSDNEMLKMWEIFIRAYKELFGENKELEAEIYLYLGLLLNGTNPKNQLQNSFPSHSVKHFGLAEKCLLKSVELNTSKDAYLELINYYKTNGKKKEYGSLVDSVIEIFPKDKDLLCEAGNMAAGRNAYNKSIEYFERAYSLDTIDSNLRELLISSYIKAARSVISNKNGLSKMRKFMDKAESLCLTDSKGLDSQLRFVVVKRAALEFYKGNYQKGNEELQRAFTMPGKREQLLFFSYLILRAYGISIDIYYAVVKDVDSIFSLPAQFGLAMDFVEVLEYTRNLSGVSMDAVRCINYFTKAIENERPQQNDFKRVFALADEFNITKQARTIVKKALRTDPDNPFYCFYDYYFKRKDAGYISPYNLQKIISNLQCLIETAFKRNDMETVSLITKEFQEIAAIRNSFEVFTK